MPSMVPPLRMVVSLLGLGFAFHMGGCKQARTHDGEAPALERSAVELQLPEPFPLPADPALATWLARPVVVLERVQPYLPVAVDLRSAARDRLGGITTTDLAETFAGSIDLDAPFGNVVLGDGEEVVRLSPQPSRRQELESRLASLDPIGEFGAVILPSPESGATRQWLAWLDPQDQTLVLATSERGLVTARGLPGAYGQQSIFFTLDPAAIPMPVKAPLGRVRGAGNLDSIHLEVDRLAQGGEDPLQRLPIAEGTLGGLLQSPSLSLGVSSRFAEHEGVVKDVIREVGAQVDQLPFLVRGIAEDMAKKLNTVLRSWDGRLLAAIGPVGHARLAYGSEDPEHAKVAMLRLLQGAVDNIKFARNFVSEVPRVTLRRNVGMGDGCAIDVLVIHDASRLLAPEIRGLIDAENRLTIAMAWSHRIGGGAIVAGPQAAEELTRWLEDTKSSPSGADTGGQLLAALLGADPEGVRTLAQQPAPDPEALLGLEPAKSPRWSLSIEEQGHGYAVELVDLSASGEAGVRPRRAR